MPKQNTNQKRSAYHPSREHPELLELAVDVAVFARKWKPKRMARAIGITHQSLNEHIEKRNERSK